MKVNDWFRETTSFIHSRAVNYGFAATLILIVTLTLPAHGQTYQVLHNFAGQSDGSSPIVGVVMDRAGNLYGTTEYGGRGYGGVFQLKHRNSAWVFDPIYSFSGTPDGFNPTDITVGPDGTLYGTANGGPRNNGIVFNVGPPAHPCLSALCIWRESLPYSFSYTDGAGPASVVFDQAGNIYGTATAGGNPGCGEGCGVVFKLTHSGGSWTETDYAFTGGSDGGYPYGQVLLGSDGNLYGATRLGGAYGSGTVYQLTPSGSGWTETTIHDFQSSAEGFDVYAGLISDAAGNLYGAAFRGGPNNAGSVFELTPSAGGWTFTLLYAFPGQFGAGCFSNLVMAGGSLYGTTASHGVYGLGTLFKLTPSNGSWTYTSLYDFTGSSDGRVPYGSPMFDANGNLYGTTTQGGTSPNCNNGCGVIWEFTP